MIGQVVATESGEQAAGMCDRAADRVLGRSHSRYERTSPIFSPIMLRFVSKVRTDPFSPTPGPEESSRVDLFHLCFGCGVQIERVQGKFRGQSAPNTAFTMKRAT